MSAGSITLTQNPDGEQTLRWELSIDQADQVVTSLAATGNNPLLDALYRAVSEAVDKAPLADGCEHFWPDSKVMDLTEPAILGSTNGDMLSVLIPGELPAGEAAALALTVAEEAGVVLPTTHLNATADIHPARWVILNTCESPTHDFHPTLAFNGPRTPGAVQVTRVDLINFE